MDSGRSGGEDAVIGVVSDTHIPDRVFDLHPDLLPALKREGVQLILHAGDISSQKALDDLAGAAPVKAVRGNRDILSPAGLAAYMRIKIHGVSIYLTHGHGSIVHYLWDKWLYMLQGYQFQRYHQYLDMVRKDAGVVVFGHTHRPENRVVGTALFFNPGSAGPNYEDRQPSFGVLRINPRGETRGEIHLLEKIGVRNHRWLR